MLLPRPRSRPNERRKLTLDLDEKPGDPQSDVGVSSNGIELQHREFIAAIRERREPNSSVAQVIPCYRVLAEVETMLAK